MMIKSVDPMLVAMMTVTLVFEADKDEFGKDEFGVVEVLMDDDVCTCELVVIDGNDNPEV